MKIDASRFAVAVASVWAIAALLCAVVFKTAPAAYFGTANFLLHTGMFAATRAVGWGELLLAVALWWILVALLAGAAASLYNRMALKVDSVGTRTSA